MTSNHQQSNKLLQMRKMLYFECDYTFWNVFFYEACWECTENWWRMCIWDRERVIERTREKRRIKKLKSEYSWVISEILFIYLFPFDGNALITTVIWYRRQHKIWVKCFLDGEFFFNSKHSTAISIKKWCCLVRGTNP